MYLPVSVSRSASDGISVEGLRFNGLSLLLPRCLSSSVSRFFLTVGVGERATEGILSCENWRELMNVGNEFTVDGLCGIQESMKYFGRRQSFYELLGFHGKSRWYPVIQRVGWSRAPDGTRVQISNLLPSGTALVSSKEWMCYIHEKGKDVTHLEKI